MDYESIHKPVMLNEIISLSMPLEGKKVLDCTLGMGGHTEAFLSNGAMVTGIDRDVKAREISQERLTKHSDRFSVLDGSFAETTTRLISEEMKYDVVLADLGVSSLQLDDMERGFSIKSEQQLDMRMGDGCEMSALELIDDLSEEDLADVLYKYGEERRSYKIAKAMKIALAEGKTSCVEMADMIRRVIKGHQKRHPALRSFQGLRIAVNKELLELEILLENLPKLLSDKGIGLIISFHSLEDRLVKMSFRKNKRETKIYTDVSKKVIKASKEEILENNRSHSAHLRYAIFGEAQ